MFRLWIIASALIFVATGFLSFADVKQAADWQAVDDLSKKDTLMLPADCADNLRGLKGVDWTNDGSGPCWYELPKFRKLYPEYANLSDDELGKRMYAKAGMPLKKTTGPILLSLQRMGIAALLSALLLVTGLAIRWVFLGFVSKRPD